MHVRHASLLELHGVGVADDLPEEFSIEDVLEHLLHLQIEDTACEDRVILPGRVRQQVLLEKTSSSVIKTKRNLDFFPFGVPGESHEEIGRPCLKRERYHRSVKRVTFSMTAIECSNCFL